MEQVPVLRLFGKFMDFFGKAFFFFLNKGEKVPELSIQSTFSHNVRIPSFKLFLLFGRSVEFGDSMNSGLDLLFTLPQVRGSY